MCLGTAGSLLSPVVLHPISLLHSISKNRSPTTPRTSRNSSQASKQVSYKSLVRAGTVSGMVTQLATLEMIKCIKGRLEGFTSDGGAGDTPARKKGAP